MILINNFQGRLAIDINQQPIKDACYIVLQSSIKQRHYNLKKTYFTGIHIDQIRTTSPIPYMTDA
jgi:hypothetical protein